MKIKIVIEIPNAAIEDELLRGAHQGRTREQFKAEALDEFQVLGDDLAQAIPGGKATVEIED